MLTYPHRFKVGWKSIVPGRKGRFVPHLEQNLALSPWCTCPQRHCSTVASRPRFHLTGSTENDEDEDEDDIEEEEALDASFFFL